MITALEGVAIVALWESGRFRTDEIADVLKQPEAEVDFILNRFREARRPVDLRVVAGRAHRPAQNGDPASGLPLKGGADIAP